MKVNLTMKSSELRPQDMDVEFYFHRLLPSNHLPNTIPVTLMAVLVLTTLLFKLMPTLQAYRAPSACLNFRNLIKKGEEYLLCPLAPRGRGSSPAILTCQQAKLTS